MSLFKEPLIVSDQRTKGSRNLISGVRLDDARSTNPWIAYLGRDSPRQSLRPLDWDAGAA
jgi:hypothetical protein